MELSHLNFESKKKLASYLSEYVSENKQALIEKILPNRTRYITVILEDIYQPHNASAVIRSCEAFGVQDIHIIEQRNAYRINPDITLGSNKWVNISNYKESGTNNTQTCLKGIKKSGYKIVATTLQPGSIDLSELPLDEKLAISFGNEKSGLTEEAHELSDYFVKIPMTGFSQSLNLSVSAAICMYDIMRRLKSTRSDWQLSEVEQLDLKIDWMLRNLKNPQKYLKNFKITL